MKSIIILILFLLFTFTLSSNALAAPEKPVADFNSPRVIDQQENHNEIGPNDVVSFIDNSTGSPTSWFWDFGDGSTSTKQNPTHVYGAIGRYTVNLTVANENGTDSKLTTIKVIKTNPYAYVTNYNSNTVSVIDTTTNNVTATVPVGISPWGVAVSPDGTRVYVTNWNSNTVSVIDTNTNTVIATVDVGNNPMGIAVTPDGSKVYVANDNSDNVSVIDTTTKTVTATVELGYNPMGLQLLQMEKKCMSLHGLG